LAVAHEAVDRRPADEARRGAKCGELDDVTSPTNTSVDENLQVTADRRRDLLQGTGGGGLGVELPPAVVGHEGGVGTGVASTFGVLSGHDTLDDELARPSVSYCSIGTNGTLVPTLSTRELRIEAGRSRAEAAVVAAPAPCEVAVPACPSPHAATPNRDVITMAEAATTRS
jgi:hypothetical protein